MATACFRICDVLAEQRYDPPLFLLLLFFFFFEVYLSNVTLIYRTGGVQALARYAKESLVSGWSEGFVFCFFVFSRYHAQVCEDFVYSNDRLSNPCKHDEYAETFSF